MAASSVSANGVQLQPSTPVPIAEFVRATNEVPNHALAFFGADSLFVLSYLLVFVGLYGVTTERARPFALLGLGAGIFTAFMDASENAYFITYALNSIAGIPLTTPDLPLIYIIANLKWMGAFATLYAFALVFPRRSPMEWLLAGLMLLFPLVGVASFVVPNWIMLRGVFFLIGMPLFAVYFFQQSRRVVVN
ncbi:MAG: hypothetical protein K8I30_19470 [Anaerolineae bacterium]|nr:hypothetical protein [Anaerolineae bacterium]